MESKSVLFVLLIICICSAIVLSATTPEKTDYCPYKCSFYKNIGCNNTGAYSTSCKNPTDINLSADDQKFILHRINDYRNRVSNGSVDGAPPCKRCATVKWDPYLAHQATLLTRECAFTFKSCTNTKEFNATDSITTTWDDSDVKYDFPLRDMMSSTFEMWFDQHKDSNCSNSDNICKLSIGNYYTQMMRGNATAMGCGGTITHETDYNRTRFTCVFSQKNMYGSIHYQVGKPASGCTTGSNPEFPALCSLNEKIDANSYTNPGDPAKCWANYTGTEPYGTTTTTDFCKSNCGSQKNTGCNANQAFGPDCRNAAIINFDQKLRDHILYLHNMYRERVCNGSTPGYSQCSQSASMIWDNDLAYLAGLNTRNCSVRHDECRNTPKWNTVGQNIATISRDDGFLSTEESTNECVKMWFNEWPNADDSYVQAYKTNPKGVMGHFSQLTWGNATRVGCGATQYYNPRLMTNTFTMACNYPCGNMMGSTWYFTGKAGSKCKTGTNPQFPSLCSVNEPLDANSYHFKTSK